MTHSTGQFPNETYANGLRDNPEPTLAVLYNEFRMPVLRTITEIGGRDEEAASAFLIAVNDTARLAREGRLPKEVSFYEFLKTLGLAHYADLAQEKNPDQPAPVSPEPEMDPDKSAFALPSPGERRETRDKMRAWECLHGLDPACRNILLGQTEAPVQEPDEDEGRQASETCRKKYLQLLSADSEAEAVLPAWAEAACTDREGYAVWSRTRELEQNWSAEPPAAPESNRIWRWAVGILLLVAVGYGAYQLYFRPKTAAEVFADNFAPPASLMKDMEARYGAEMGNDSSGAQPNQCLLLLQEADVYYQAKEYKAAIDPLLLIALDSNSICQSDTWYFLGIIHLKLEEPTTAIQCFAKIEDLQRYGEDLYWYQALAFVQLAKENPLLRDKARRAVERTLGNTRDPQRRLQAETMLKNLAE